MNAGARPIPIAARHRPLRAVARPILWCAITGAIGYGALVISDVVPIQQFGAILGICTLVAALLVMAISPIAMLPPFPLEVPVRHGSDSWVSAQMNRLTASVVLHPAPIVATVFLIVLPMSLGIGGLQFESNFINAFKPQTRVVKDYAAVESRLGGIGLVELIVPMNKSAAAPATSTTFASLRKRSPRSKFTACPPSPTSLDSAPCSIPTTGSPHLDPGPRSLDPRGHVAN